MFNQDCATLIQDFFQENCIQDSPKFIQEGLISAGGWHGSVAFQFQFPGLRG